MRQIFDRLPDPLQAKWRKSAKLHRERTSGKEQTLKELSAFITGESQTENDTVYGRLSTPMARVRLQAGSLELLIFEFSRVKSAFHMCQITIQ